MRYISGKTYILFIDIWLTKIKSAIINLEKVYSVIHTFHAASKQL